MSPKKILITGAAGSLGKSLREQFAGQYGLIRLSDMAPMAPAGKGEETVQCDLADAEKVAAMCAGIDAIVHLGGQSVEGPLERVVHSNIIGLLNLYEGARKAKVDRVLFASSNHAVGFWKRSDKIDHTAACKPDSRYGLSKAFGEDVSRYYAYKHGIRGFNMRIGSCFARPENFRMLSTWLSFADLARLVRVGIEADYVYEIVYGVSKNTRNWWDNANAHRLGYTPDDDSERFAAEVGHIHFPDGLDEELQGGQYVSADFSGRRDWVL